MEKNIEIFGRRGNIRMIPTVKFFNNSDMVFWRYWKLLILFFLVFVYEIGSIFGVFFYLKLSILVAVYVFVTLRMEVKKLKMKL
jgi:hypothetical protein